MQQLQCQHVSSKQFDLKKKKEFDSSCIQTCRSMKSDFFYLNSYCHLIILASFFVFYEEIPAKSVLI